MWITQDGPNDIESFHIVQTNMAHFLTGRAGRCHLFCAGLLPFQLKGARHGRAERVEQHGESKD